MFLIHENVDNTHSNEYGKCLKIQNILFNPIFGLNFAFCADAS